jgi:hypothetical protein
MEKLQSGMAGKQPAKQPSARASGSRITLLFILLALVVCALLNPGNFGSIDTARRWQVARSIRLGEPMVTPRDALQGFGIPGRNGERQAWYGLGQSLLLLPIDALVDASVAPLLRQFGLDPIRQKQVAELIIAFLMQSFLTACVLVLSRHVLLSFGFGEIAAVAGSLGLLFATTSLQYVQCAQENELLLVLALATLAALRAWHRQQHWRRCWPAWRAASPSWCACLPCWRPACLLFSPSPPARTRSAF